MYVPLLRYLESRTGYRFRLAPVPQAGSVIADLDRGHVDFAAIAMLSCLQASARYEVQALVAGRTASGSSLYQAMVVETAREHLQSTLLLAQRCRFPHEAALTLLVRGRALGGTPAAASDLQAACTLPRTALPRPWPWRVRRWTGRGPGRIPNPNRPRPRCPRPAAARSACTGGAAEHPRRLRSKRRWPITFALAAVRRHPGQRAGGSRSQGRGRTGIAECPPSALPPSRR